MASICRRSPAGTPLKPGFAHGFEYSDCWVDDARLVVLNAMDAAARGADIRVRTEVMSASRSDGHWRIDLHNTISGRHDTVKARALVNASGAWVADTTGRRIKSHAVPRVRLVRGSHIVVNKLFDHDRAYIFQNSDRRIIFAIPYEADFTLIGTTDVDFRGDISRIAISEEETTYLCDAANEYFVKSIEPSDVVWSYSGVRSLQDDGRASAQDATRDFVLVRDGRPGEPPLVSIVGGKITTYRHLAEEAMRDAPGVGTPRPPVDARRAAAGRRLRARWPRPAGPRSRRRLSAAGRGHRRSPGENVRHHGANACSPALPGARIWGSTSAPISTSARWTISSRTNGR